MKYFAFSIIGLAAIVAVFADGVPGAPGLSTSSYPRSGQYHRVEFDENGDPRGVSWTQYYETGSKAGFEEELSKIFSVNCETDHVASGGGEFTYRGTCKMKQFRDVPIEAWGTYDSSSFEIHSRFTILNDPVEGSATFTHVDR